MKKILAASAALIMAGSCFTVTNAMAADEAGITFGGDARFRVRYLDNIDFGNSNKDAYDKWDSRFRLKVNAKAAGGAYAKTRIRTTETIFNGEVDAGSNKNIWADYGYIGIPLGTNFTLEGGKYSVTYGNAFLIEDLKMTGVRGIYKTDAMELITFYEIMKEGQAGNANDKMKDNDTLRYGATLSANMDAWTIGFIAAYQSDDTTDEVVDPVTEATSYADVENEGFFGSVFLSGDMGMFALETELAYAEEGLTDWNYNQDDGMGAYVKATYKMDALSLGLNLGMTQDGFVPDAAYGYEMIGGDATATIVTVGEDGDWMVIGMQTEYQATEALALTANLAYATVDAECDDSDSTYMEISGKLAYTISKGASFSWFAGYLMPDFDNAALEDDAAFATYGIFQVKF
ncbi:MAG: hypothetical protein CSA33_00870 [Desulfobulbus propionicus]|nr:MAG: hypothetical protein CSA33_00870 [Desulfobulbus propionicus]